VRVDVSTRTDTFFLGVFGIDSVSLNRHAIADQQEPLKLGGDKSTLGSTGDHFWLAINGERRRKQDGDPFATRCISAGCNSTTNDLWRNPSYYYAVEVGQADVDAGREITVSVYDGESSECGNNLTFDIVPGSDNGCNGDERGNVFTFSLIAPDSTPGQPSDNRKNSIAAGNPSGHMCSREFDENDGIDAWISVCRFTPNMRGIYVLEVKADGDLQAINGFGLRATGGTSTSVYAMEYLSLWMRDAGTQPTVQIVKITSDYAGSQLIVGAFDLGDINGNANAHITFGGALAGVDCRVRTLDHNMRNPSSWGSDDSAGGSCKLTTKKGSSGGNQGIYNNKWVEFVFDVPTACRSHNVERETQRYAHPSHFAEHTDPVGTPAAICTNQRSLGEPVPLGSDRHDVRPTRQLSSKVMKRSLNSKPLRVDDEDFASRTGRLNVLCCQGVPSE
jgi:hypothetical protein